MVSVVIPCSLCGTELVRKRNRHTRKARCSKCRYIREPKDFSGRRFGRLVVKTFHRMTEDHVSEWLCQCDCGNEKIVDIAHLGRHTNSCGCLAKENKIARLKKSWKTKFLSEKPSYAALNAIYRYYVEGAYRRGLSFELTKDEFENIIQLNCFYCNCEPSNIRKRVSGDLKYNGIDRLNPKIGYILSNCVSCCWKCNYAKQDLDYSEFTELIGKIYKHLLEKNNG